VDDDARPQVGDAGAAGDRSRRRSPVAVAFRPITAAVRDVAAGADGRLADNTSVSSIRSLFAAV
jgi:hypothetical protein